MMRFVFIFISVLLCSLRAVAEEPPSRFAYRQDERLANCTFYRSKKAAIPVYAEPDQSSKVVGRLELGEEVCYIGEQQTFAILDWAKQHVIRGGQAELKPSKAHVRLVDLWPPRDRRSRNESLIERAKAYYELRRSGVVPEDPFGPFRSTVENATSDGAKPSATPSPASTTNPITVPSQ